VTGATFLLAALVIAALWTVQTTVLRAAFGLGIVSALLTALMFEMGAPLAGVFELSICAGLITVILVSTVSLTPPRGREAERALEIVRKRRFHPAIILAACVGALIWIGSYQLDVAPAPATGEDVREVLWGTRRLELVGLMIVLFAGVFAVVVLLKERERKQKEASR
jgi:NADH-quinone oxidoreductase subunit J